MTREQSEGAKQILEAMDEVAAITSDLAATSDETTSAMTRIEELSHQLAEAVARFST